LNWNSTRSWWSMKKEIRSWLFVFRFGAVENSV